MGDHRMVRNGLLQDKETENGQNGKERELGLQASSKEINRKEKKREGYTDCFCAGSLTSHLSLPSFVCFLGGFAFPKRDKTIYGISNGNATHATDMNMNMNMNMTRNDPWNCKFIQSEEVRRGGPAA